MNQFMDKDFLLDTPTGVKLYHEFAQDCPIVDYHNHLNPRDIAEHRTFGNLTELWLEGDHYKWRAMRACGVEEEYITGNASAYEKFLSWAETIPKLIGNPLYHWTHLELQRYFNIATPLSSVTAPEIWDKSKKITTDADFDTVSLLKKQKVIALCTTDDPTSALHLHEIIAKDKSIPFRVLPSFRPDRFLSPSSKGWKVALAELGEHYDVQISDLSSLKEALSKALDHFEQYGCRISDHGFTQFGYCRGEADEAFTKAFTGRVLTKAENDDLVSELLRFLGEEYNRRHMIMQLHLGAIRNNSPRLWDRIGADAGADSIGELTDPFALSAFLSDLERDGVLPKTILFNLNPAENAMFSTMAANFAPQVQYGPAWWFNDHIRGIDKQIDELMETGQLFGSLGMLTDSRSFTSFVRHEYFRRILCAKLGHLVENGQYPDDIPFLGKMVRKICYENAAKALMEEQK